VWRSTACLDGETRTGTTTEIVVVDVAAAAVAVAVAAVAAAAAVAVAAAVVGVDTTVKTTYSFPPTERWMNRECVPTEDATVSPSSERRTESRRKDYDYTPGDCCCCCCCWK